MRPTKYDVLIVPGWQDSEPEHWQSLWQTKYGYTRVIQDDWMYPKRQSWVQRLSEVAAHYDFPILIAHSMGCSAAGILSAETHIKIAGAFLVSPVDLDLPTTPEEIKNFLPTPMQRLRFPSMVIASDNDPYCSIQKAQAFAKTWGNTFMNLGSHGHINVAAGFGPWEEGHHLFQKFLDVCSIL